MTFIVSDTEKEILRNISIPAWPEIVKRVTDEIKQPEPDIEKVSAILSQDVSLSAAVLIVANSAVFRRTREYTSIHQAVMVLGLKRLAVVVNAVALKHALGESDDLESYWRKCGMVADFMHFIAIHTRHPSLADTGYMLGLFHVAGIPVMLKSIPHYQRFYNEANQIGWSEAVGKEKVNFGTTHTTISAILARKWKLPTPLVEAIYHYHNPKVFSWPKNNATTIRLLSYLKLARHFTRIMMNQASSTSEWQNSKEHVCEAMNWSEDELDELQSVVMADYQAHR